eukprot:12180154-Ditylum_brightwellii.AAC.1
MLREVMTYVIWCSYPEGHTFLEMELLWLQLHDIYHWMYLKVYGKDNPSPEDNPTYRQSSSLEYYKKALSFFMPCQLEVWNVTTNSGNPTRPVDVNNLIKAVGKKEVIQLRKKSLANCAFEDEEFM